MNEEIDITETRSGRFIPHPEGYRTFIPWGLPPKPPIEPDSELWLLLSQASAALGKLDGAAATVPNPESYNALYVRREVIFSSQIEGTVVSLQKLLENEAGVQKTDPNWEMKHVLGCLAATQYGLQQIQQSPVTMDLIMSCHEKLYSTGFRGKGTLAGVIRDAQNYVGAPGSTVQTARFVPPPPDKVTALLENLQDFCQNESQMPILVKVGLIHSQFETIHPFEDGNGPIGRLLILLALLETTLLSQPLLYLSSYFMKHRKEYYDRLQAVRDQGNWEGWLKFFLRAVLHSSQHAAGIAIQIVQQRETLWRTIAQEMGTNAACGLTLLEELYPHPIMSVEHVAKITKKNPNDAKKLIAMFQRLGVLKEITGRARGQYFAFDPYLNLFADKTADFSDEQSSTLPEQITEAAGIEPS